MEGLKGNSFAVRSSYTGEDNKTQSFAGQFLTLLNVKKTSVKDAVEKVRASASNGVTYIETLGLNTQEKGSMEVIIQEMIEPEFSAVLFTANPQGILNESVLVVGRGFGAGVVEDKVPTTTYYYNLTDKIYCFESQEEAPTLDDNTLKNIFELGTKIQNLFNDYMDIELGIKEKEIYILQARPITTIEEGEDLILDNSNISESYPGMSSPSTQSFAKVVYYQAFKSCVSLLAGKGKTLIRLDNTFENMVASANGRMYYQISNWYSLLKVLPFSNKIIPMWQEMLGVEQKDVKISYNVEPSIWIKIRIAFAFGRLMVTTPKEMDKLKEYFESEFPRFKERLEVTDENLDLIALFKEARDEIGSKWGITLINDMYAFLYTYLAKRKSENKIGDIQKIESLKPVRALEKLALIAKESGLESEKYKKAKEEYLIEFGDRSFEELKLETHTMNTHPEILDQYIRAYRTEIIPEMRKNEEAIQKSRDSYFVTRAKKGIYNRELSRMNRTRLFGFVRQVLRKIGKNLVSERIIEEVDDVFWIYIEELEECCKEKKDMKSLIKERQRLNEKLSLLPAYRRLVFRNRIIEKNPNGINNEEKILGEACLEGVPSSSGIVTGEALVVTNPSLELDTRGKILVADITDPGWVFLVKNAKGIVTQRGSILSHTAIITRELKKPSVVAVSGVLTYIKTGDIIRIDGDKGTVEVINDESN